jgi:hypothetical protein
MYVKFMFSKKATKFDKIFTVNLTLCSKCQIDGEDFTKFCGLLRIYELYHINTDSKENCIKISSVLKVVFPNLIIL